MLEQTEIKTLINQSSFALCLFILYKQNKKHCTCYTIVLQTKWATKWQNQQSDCAPSKDTDQPGHLPSLIRVFAVSMKKPWALSCPLSTQRRLWSDWADAQADLGIRWAHTHFVGFVMSRLKLLYNIVKIIDRINRKYFLKLISLFQLIENLELTTVIFLNFQTDRSGQTVQTQIRLLRVYTVYNYLCIFWMHYSKETPSCLTFRVITTNVLGVRMFRKFTVFKCLNYKKFNLTVIKMIKWKFTQHLLCDLFYI